jgi:ATP-binding cassette subfamily B protein RaxB
LTTHNIFSLRRSREPPVILQTEEAECGLAALAMCAAVLGYETDLLALRRRHEISGKGTTLARLLEIAADMKMHGRAVRLDLHELGQLKTPCILHWELNHFVVLVRAGASGIVVNDPALGRRQYSMEETSKRFSGVALELSARADFVKKEEKTPLDLSAFFSGQRGLVGAFTQVLLLSLVLETFSVLYPLLNQWLIDDVLITNDANLLLVLVAAVVLLTLTSTATRLLRSWILLAASISWNLQSSANVFLHMIRLPVSFFEKRHVGDVSSRFRAVDEIQDTISTNFIESFLDGLMAVVALVMMFIYSATLGWLVVGAAFLYGAVRFFMFGRYRRATEETLVRKASRDSYFYETLRGMPAIKFFSQMGWRVTGWMNRQTDVANATVTTKKLDLVYQTANGLISALERGLILYLMARMILDKQFTIGMMVAFLAYKEQFLSRIVALVERLARFRLLRLQGERLADIVLTTPEPYGELADRSRLDARGPITIELRNVSFRYAPGEDQVLKNISLTLTTSDSIAIVGPSGCGKSTLMKVITGILEPEEGEVLVNGLPLARIGVEAYRSVIGTLMQEDYLFSGSIFDNISMFDSAADQERVIAAAKLAIIHDDIVMMPMGYQSLVGGMGANLSGGQKQRILLARALYKQPRFLLLDEYTSMLDFETEAKVQQSLASLPVGRLVITHRRNNLLPDDKVYVVWEHGLMDSREFDAMQATAGREVPAAPA